MPTTSTRIGQFSTLVGLPDFLFPWADHFYEPMEIELICMLNGDALDAETIKDCRAASTAASFPLDMKVFLARSYKRGVLDRDSQHRFSAANFHTRYDIWALFESWQDIPDDIKYLLNAWEVDYYQDQHRPMVADLKQDRPRNTAKRWPEYLLAHEAEALIDAVAHVYLWPCNCRAMMGKCRKPIYTCLRFSNHRELGWEISKHRAKAIMHAANSKGLMQSGEISIAPDGTVGGALCNCCADCCFPHVLAERLHAEKLWPLTRYQARVNAEQCTACGRCVRRCPFEAITIHKADNDPDNAWISIDTGLCRGCGVCSTGCRDGAIAMDKLEGVDSLFDRLAL